MSRALQIALYFISEIISLVLIFTFCPSKSVLMIVLCFIWHITFYSIGVAVLDDEDDI